MPRIKNIKGGFILLKNLEKRRRGDNAPMAVIAIKGNEKTEIEKKRKW
jgi:ribosomal protein L17